MASVSSSLLDEILDSEIAESMTLTERFQGGDGFFGAPLSAAHGNEAGDRPSVAGDSDRLTLLHLAKEAGELRPRLVRSDLFHGAPRFWSMLVSTIIDHLVGSGNCPRRHAYLEPILRIWAYCAGFSSSRRGN